MQAILATARTALDAATSAYVQAGALKSDTIPPMIDEDLSVEEQLEKLRGSFIKVHSGGSDKFVAVPAAGKVWEVNNRGTKKISFIDKWGGTIATKQPAELGNLVANAREPRV